MNKCGNLEIDALAICVKPMPSSAGMYARDSSFYIFDVFRNKVNSII